MNTKRRRIIRGSWLENGGCLGIFLPVIAFCIYTMQTPLYTLFVGIIGVLYGVFVGRVTHGYWKQRVVFEHDVVSCLSNTVSTVAYDEVEAVRFFYTVNFHGQHPQIITIKLKNATRNLSSGSIQDSPDGSNTITWDVGLLNLTAVGKILVELCHRTPLDAIQIQGYKGFEMISDLGHVLRRNGELERDEATQDFVFTPFRNFLC